MIQLIYHCVTYLQLRSAPERLAGIDGGGRGGGGDGVAYLLFLGSQVCERRSVASTSSSATRRTYLAPNAPSRGVLYLGDDIALRPPRSNGAGVEREERESERERGGRGEGVRRARISVSPNSDSYPARYCSRV